jgi:hypothetical protein
MADTRKRVSAPLARPAPIPQRQVGGLAPTPWLVGLEWRDSWEEKKPRHANEHQDTALQCCDGEFH